MFFYLRILRPQLDVEYLNFKYFMRHASQLHLRFHVMGEAKQARFSTISFRHLYIVKSPRGVNNSLICGEHSVHSSRLWNGERLAVLRRSCS